MIALKKYLPILLRIALAMLLLQTLRFKFTAHEDSVYIFTKIGLEPIGRIGIGILELIASILLLLNKGKLFGIILTIGLMCGAIFMHITILGIEVRNDGGVLFGMALLCLSLGLVLLWINKADLRALIKKLFNS